MAITLTQDWQVVASHNWQPGTGFNFDMFLEARYTTQDTSTNSTKILTRLRSVVNRGQASGYGYSFNCSYCSSISSSGIWYFGTETILESSEQTIYHENDGSKSLTLYASGYVNGISYSFDINGVVNFPKIDRLPEITSLPTSITDEDDITVEFDNPGGFYIKAYFYRLSGYNFSRENITSPYTFELTDDERNEVREFMKSMQSDKVANFTIEAYSSANFSESSKIGEATKTIEVKIVNANPTVTLSVVETNQKVIDLYGTNTARTVVKNLSQLKLSSTVGLKKYATLKSRTYTYNSNQTSTTTTVTIVPTVNKVSVKVVDSRDLPISASKTLNMVDYTPMVINSYDFFRTSPTGSEIKLTADITYFQGTYNGTANAPVIQYKMGSSGTLRTLTSDDYTLDTTNNKITITNLVLDDTLAYTKAETFYLYVNDIFTSDTENDVVVKGIPTFEAGETDFQVNGTFYIADENGNVVGTLKKGSFTYSGNTYANNKRNDILLQNKFTSRPTNADATPDGSGGLSTFKATSKMTTNKPRSDGHILHMHWDNTGGYDSQLFVTYGTQPKMQLRGQQAGTWGNWKNVAMFPTVLYSNSAGTNETVTLTDNASSYDYIEIFFGKASGSGISSTRVYKSEYQNVSLLNFLMIDEVVQIQAKQVKISRTSITNIGYAAVNIQGNTSAVYISNEMRIFKVLGYKE